MEIRGAKIRYKMDSIEIIYEEGDGEDRKEKVIRLKDVREMEHPEYGFTVNADKSVTVYFEDSVVVQEGKKTKSMKLDKLKYKHYKMVIDETNDERRSYMLAQLLAGFDDEALMDELDYQDVFKLRMAVDHFLDPRLPEIYLK